MRARGNLDVSQAILEKLLQDGRDGHSLHIFAFATANLAEVYLETGKLEEAERLLGETASAAEAHGNPRDLALRKLLRARLEAAKGEEEAASASLRECLRYATEHGLQDKIEDAAVLIEARTRLAPLSSRAG